MTRLLNTSGRRWIAGGTSAGYLVLMLIAFRDLTPGGSGFQFRVGTLSRLVERTGTLTFEPVALVTVPGFTWTISPLNLVILGGLSVLVGLNVVAIYRLVTEPVQCNVGSVSGLPAVLVPLLAGGACCAPSLVLVLGLPVSGTLMSFFPYLLPVSYLLLVGNLLYLLSQLSPGSKTLQ